MVPSLFPEASSVPSGLKATEDIKAKGPSKLATSSLVLGSKSLPIQPATASMVLSGCKAMELAAPIFPLNVAFSWPVFGMPQFDVALISHRPPPMHHRDSMPRKTPQLKAHKCRMLLARFGIPEFHGIVAVASRQVFPCTAEPTQNPLRTACRLLLVISPKSTSPSLADDASISPSGAKAMEHTWLMWPVKVRRSLAVETFHNLITLKPPEAGLPPAGSKATQVTSSVWPSRVARSLPVATSRGSLTVQSPPPLANIPVRTERHRGYVVLGLVVGMNWKWVTCPKQTP